MSWPFAIRNFTSITYPYGAPIKLTIPPIQSVCTAPGEDYMKGQYYPYGEGPEQYYTDDPGTGSTGCTAAIDRTMSWYSISLAARRLTPPPVRSTPICTISPSRYLHCGDGVYANASDCLLPEPVILNLLFTVSMTEESDTFCFDDSDVTTATTTTTAIAETSAVSTEVPTTSAAALLFIGEC